jgi:predicted metalloprotease
MRWQDLRRSSNVEDRGGTFGGGGLRIGGGGIGGLGAIGLVVLGLLFGFDPSILLQDDSPAGYSDATQQQPQSAAEREMRDFVSAVLGSTEETWHDILRRNGRTYEEPHLVIYSGAVRSACGFGQAAMGPFYCPPDRRVYIDLSFFDDLRRRFHAPGDFAQAYVIAHEVGHHVQNLLGISDRIAAAQQRGSRTDANALSVRVELQADCYAGLWAHHADQAKQILEAGDVEEALNAASAIGDDRLQRQAEGHVTPDSFTHGSSAQRVRWFQQGLKAGTLQACDTFNAARL